MNRNLRLLGIGVGIRMVGNALYFPFLALFLLNVLHVGYVEIGLIIAAVGVLQLPFSYLGGLLTDRFGRRPLILLALAAECVATAALAVAFYERSLWGAVAVAAAGGTVTSAGGAAFSAYIADFAEGAERTRGFTFLRIGFNAGYSAGVTLGGILVTVVGFAGAVAIASVVLAGGTAFLGVGLEPSPRDRELAGPGGAKAGIGAASPPTVVPSRGVRESFALLLHDRVALELIVAVSFAALVAG